MLVLHLVSSIVQHGGAIGIIPSTNSVYRSCQDQVHGAVTYCRWVGINQKSAAERFVGLKKTKTQYMYSIDIPETMMND